MTEPKEPRFVKGDLIISNNGNIRTVMDVNKSKGFYTLKSKVNNIVSEGIENIEAIDLTNNIHDIEKKSSGGGAKRSNRKRKTRRSSKKSKKSRKNRLQRK